MYIATAHIDPAQSFLAIEVRDLLESIADDPQWRSFGHPLIGDDRYVLALTLFNILVSDGGERSPGDVDRLRATVTYALDRIEHRTPGQGDTVALADLFAADALFQVHVPGTGDEAWREYTRRHLSEMHPGFLPAWGEFFDLDRAAQAYRRESGCVMVAAPPLGTYVFAPYEDGAPLGVPHEDRRPGTRPY